MKLFYSPGASSLAAHIALREAGIDAELVRADLESGTVPATGEPFAAIHPMGKVPALQLDDGTILTETLAILEYVADRAPEAHLAPAVGDRARYRMAEAMSFVATELHKGFAPMFDPEVPYAYKAQLVADERPFRRMASLVERGPWVLGDRFSVADAHLFTILRLGRHAGLDFSRWPAIEPYIERVAARPAVRAAMRAEGLFEA